MKIKFFILVLITNFIQCGDSGNLQRINSEESIPAIPVRILIPETPPPSPYSDTQLIEFFEEPDYLNLENESGDDSDVLMEIPESSDMPQAEIDLKSSDQIVPYTYASL